MTDHRSRYGPQWTARVFMTALVVVAVSASQAAEEHALRGGNLPAVQLAISPATQQQGRIIGQQLLPGPPQNITRGQSFTIGDRSLELFVSSGRVALSVDGQTTQLQRQGSSFAPIIIPMENNQPYSLAFPYYRSVRSSHFIAYRSGVVMGGRVGRQTIFIYDDNMDGRYVVGQDAYGYGRSPVLAPLGTMIGTGSEIRRVTNLAADGSSITTERYDGPTGTLNIQANGNQMALFAVVGHTQEAFALPTEGGNARLTVIPGNYRVAYGIAAGRGGEAFAILQAGDLEPTEVAANGSATISIGAPFLLRFDAQKRGNNISISPRSITLHGINGEQYTQFDYQSAPRVSTLDGNRERPIGSFSYG